MKKFLKVLGMIFLVLFGSFCALVLVCAVRPQVTQKLADFLYPGRRQAVSAQAGEPGGAEEEFNGGNLMQASFSLGDSSGEEGNGGGAQLSGTDLPGTGALEGTPASRLPRAEGIDQSVNPQYIVPEIASVQVPPQVSGKSGYQQIQDEGGPIEEGQEGQLQNQPGVGSTGDGLTFDGNFYPYYQMLDEAGKHLYRQIYANANDLIMAFSPVEQVTAPKLRTVFSAVYNDHPELFWLETAYSGKYRGDGICVEIHLRMNYTAQNLDNSKAVFDEKANEILAQAASLSGNYEKEKLVHDLLIDKITYNMGAEMNQSAYSALVNGQTVCAGYARAFQYLMQQLGIPCYYCTGFAGENHAWNIISLDDGFYNVDTTWDDTEGGNYDYFNKTDQDYAGTHVRQELSIYLPACNGQRYRNLEPGSGTGAGTEPESAAAGNPAGVPEGSFAENPAQEGQDAASENPTRNGQNAALENPAQDGENAARKNPVQGGQNAAAGTSGEEPGGAFLQNPAGGAGSGGNDPASSSGMDNLRGIEDAGISEADVLSSLSDYYDDCYQQVTANGLSSFTFSNAVDGKTLAEEIYRSYRQNTYRQGYMEGAMTEVGALTCAMELEFEPLKGDRYLVTHKVNLK